MRFDEKNLLKPAITTEAILHSAIILRQPEADKIQSPI